MKLEFVQRSVGFSVRHSWIVILIAGALTLFLSYHAIHIRIDADIFNMIPQKGKVIEDIARYSTAQDTGQILIAVERLRATLEDHFVVHITGAPVFLHKTRATLLEDVPKFLILSVAVFLTIQFLSFRTLRSMALPLLVVGLSTVWTVGTMRLLGFELTILLAAVTTSIGIVYCILLSLFFFPAIIGLLPAPRG